jgi:hypothetical protein
MGVLLGKDRSLCATCVYWGGQRKNYGKDLDVEPCSYGKCLHPDNSYLNDRMATENSCPKFVLYPYLNS